MLKKLTKKLFKKKTGKNIQSFAGDDGTLIYWVECLDCGTIIKSDHSHPFCTTDWKCPTCIKQENFKFKYWTKAEIDNMKGGREFIDGLKESYQKYYGRMNNEKI